MKLPRFPATSLAWATLLMLADISSLGQDGSLGIPTIQSDRSVQFLLTGPNGRLQRIDVSTNLFQWNPFQMISTLGETNPLPVADPAAAGQPRRFYRVREIPYGPTILEVSPARGVPGDLIRINGHFTHGNPMQETEVRFGGVPVELISASLLFLEVRVPTNALTGLVTVHTPQGVSTAPQPFILTRQIPFTVLASGGVPANEFEVLNGLMNAPLTGPSGTIPIRAGLPMVTIATPLTNRTSSTPVLFAVTGGNETNLVLSAQSTARALVFLCPMFLGTDPGYVAQFLSIVEADPKVQDLGTVLALHMSTTADVFTNSVVQQAYADALRSVATNQSAVALTAAVYQKVKRQRMGRLAALTSYAADLEYVEVSSTDEDGKPLLANQRLLLPGVGPRYPWINSVDWTALVEEIDVELAFPNGREDFNRDWRGGRSLTNYPLTGLFKAERSVEANLVTERLNPFKYFSGKLLDLTKDLFGQLTGTGDDESLRFPDRNGLYVVRAIGPGFYSSEDMAFAFEHYPQEYIRALSLNLIAAVMDTIGVLIDTEDVTVTSNEDEKDWKEFMAKLLLEANKKVPEIKTPEDFPGAVVDLIKWAVIELADKGREALMEEGAKKAVGTVFGSLSKALGGPAAATLKAADLAGSVGQVAQRVDGLLSSTAVETGFIVVGDPFALQVLSVEPPTAKPGTEVTITFRGPRTLPAFRPAEDHVWFEGPDMFETPVQSASGPTPDGTQTLVVRLPVELPASAEGTYLVAVTTRGRRGEGSFQLISRPVISSITPAEGFAAGGLFLGQTFAGTEVRVSGINFRATNEFYFNGAAGLVTVTQKSGQEGTVFLNVPAGAITGPIQVVRRRAGFPAEEAQSVPFTVLGPPEIESVSPSRGPINTLIFLRLRNSGSNPGHITVMFNGAALAAPLTVSEGLCLVRVPTDAQTGLVHVRTPAGEVQFNFDVEPGLAQGSYILVGGNSVITPERAGQFASGLAVPDDDADFIDSPEGGRIHLDPPDEEGDFLTDTQGASLPRYPVGSAFSDSIRIMGTVAGNLTLTGDREYVANVGIVLGGEQSGTLVGNLVLAGNNCRIASLDLQGTLTILGSNNLVSIRITNAPGHGLIVRGNGNYITAEVAGTQGDGVRIEGAQRNTLRLTQVSGCAGSGLVVTDGAEFNDIQIDSTGNGGHGVAFLSSAHHNSLYGTSRSNQFDGLLMDGANVNSNLVSGVERLRFFISHNNGRNGVTVTNAANRNTFGYLTYKAFISSSQTYTPVVAENNAGHGVAFYDSHPDGFRAQCNGNLGYGALLSGVIGGSPYSDSLLYVETGLRDFTNTVGNGIAGVRFERGTRQVQLMGNLARDPVGVVLEGPDVQDNWLGGDVVRAKFTTAFLSEALYVHDTLTDGIVLTNSSHNRIFVEDLLRCGRNGLVLHNSHTNTIRLSVCSDHTNAAAVYITENSSANRLFSLKAPILAADLRTSRWGIVLDRGAQRNHIESAAISRMTEQALVLTGSGTSGNRIQGSTLSRCGAESILLSNGASGNFIGPDHQTLDFLRVDDTTNGIARINGVGTSGNVLRNFWTLAGTSVGSGVIIENQADGNQLYQLKLRRLSDCIIFRDGATNNRVQGCTLDTSTRAILISNAPGNLVGGLAAGEGNLVFGNQVNLEISGSGSTGNWVANNSFTGAGQTGVLLQNNAATNRIGPGNTIETGLVGLHLSGASHNVITGNRVDRNLQTGIRLSTGAAGNQLLLNTLFQNVAGILLTDTTTLTNTLTRNSITDHAGRGIGLDLGANRMLAPPRITEITTTSVSGDTDAEDGSTVEIFQDAADEGQLFVAAAPVLNGRFRAAIGGGLAPFLFRVNGTVTDTEGNTSPFSEPAGAGAVAYRLALTSTRDGNQEIYLLDPTLAAPTRFTFNNALDYSPTLSLDHVAWVSTRSNNSPEIFVAPISGFPIRQLTTNDVPDYDPAWFPGGGRLAFATERDGNPEIYLVESGGTNLVRLTDHPASDTQPSVSPDGQSIVLVSDRFGSADLFIVNTNGANLLQLTSAAGSNTKPSWSPDGQRIAFVSDRDGNPEIYVINSDGTGTLRMTHDPSTDRDPAWLPDGTGIVFASNRSGGYELLVVPATGGTATRLTFSIGDSFQPSASAKP